MIPQSTRRQLLKGITLGTGGLLLDPVLGQLAAHADGDLRAARKRVVFVLQCNGINPAHVTPAEIGAPTERGNSRPNNDTLFERSLRDHDLPAPIAALAPHKNRMAIVRGLSGRIALSDHSGNHGALGCYPANRGPLGPTIDVALGDALPSVFRHVALGIMNRPEQTMNYSLCAAGPGRTVPIQCAPELAYRNLFGSVAGGSSREAFDRRSALLDFMADDVRATRNRLAGPERQQLDSYLEAFENLRDRQGAIERLQGDMRRHAPNLDEKFRRPTETNRLEAQFEIAAAALIVGLTNVVTLTSGGGGQQYVAFPELGIPVDGHHYGHGGGVPGKTYEECFVAVRQFHCRLIAELCRKLQAVPEGDGTMLDNTLIVYLSDSGDGHHPQLYDWPMVLIGNLGGRLRTSGRYLQFPRYGAAGHRTTANLYATLLHAAGRPTDRFGVADPGLRDLDQRGTVNELLA
jgi:hypothetical protein